MCLKKYTLPLVFLIAPIFYYADRISPNIRDQQFTFLMAAAYIILAVHHPNQWMRAFLAYAGVLGLVLHGPMTDYRLMFIGVGVIIHWAVLTAPGPSEGKTYRYAAVGILVFTIVSIIVQKAGEDVYFFQELAKAHPSGAWTLPNYMGIYAAVTAPFVAYLHPVLFLFAVIPALYARSVSVVAVFMVVMVTYFFKRSWLKRPWILALIYFVFMGGVFASFQSDMKNGGEPYRRLMVWKMVMSKAFRHPVWGQGPGSYKETFFIEFRGMEKNYWLNVKWDPENTEALKKAILEIAKDNGTDTTRIETIHFKDPRGPFWNMKGILDDLRGKGENPLLGWVWDHPHNEYILIFYEFGLIGILIFGGYAAQLLFASFKLWDNKDVRSLACSFLAMLALATLHFPFSIPRLSIPCIVIAALLERKLKNGAS